MFDKEFNIMKEAILYVGDNIFLKGASKKTSKGKSDYFTDKDIACEKYIIDTIKSNFLNFIESREKPVKTGKTPSN